MSFYKIITIGEIDFSDAPKAKIDSYKWGEGYTPKAYAQLIYVKNKGFALKMTAVERNPRALCTEYGDPVYEDSCLEFFVRFNSDSPLYMNFEVNSNGAFLASVRKERRNKRNIHEITSLPEVMANRQEECWTIESFFSIGMIEALFGKCDLKKGSVFFGNFYKCGDKTEHPHYGMWSPIQADTPDFHRPEFFGKLVIE